jgi:hypothetical protein
MPYEIRKIGSKWHLVNVSKRETVSRHDSRRKAEIAKGIRERFHRKGK